MILFVIFSEKLIDFNFNNSIIFAFNKSMINDKLK